MRVFLVVMLVLAVLPLAVTPEARAQLIPGPQVTDRPFYDMRTMNFDLWCQETQRFPMDRCNERRPEDVRAFEDYRTVIERYELELLKQREREIEAQQRLNREPNQYPGLLDPFAR